MKTKSLIMNLMHLFKSYRVSNDAKESLMRSIMTIILTQSGSQFNDLQYPSSFKEDNLYIQLVEPLAYLYTNREEPLKIRYLAQETLAVLASSLSRTSVLEALFECLADDKFLYDKFCDRLDAECLPFLSQVNGGVKKLEFPLPPSHVYSVRAEPKDVKQERMGAADRYYSQDFNENPSEVDFSTYNQVLSKNDEEHHDQRWQAKS